MAKTAESENRWPLCLRILALSQPNRFKISQKYDPVAVCRLMRSYFSVRKGALKGKSTPRTIALAEPKKGRKDDPAAAARLAHMFTVKRSALKAKLSPRNEMLSRNRVRTLLNNLEYHRDRGDNFISNMNKYIELAKASMYICMYWPKAPLPPEPPPMVKACMFKLRGCPPDKSPSEMYAELKQWCLDNSVPKQMFLPEPLPPGKRKPLNELKKRLMSLASPKKMTYKFDALVASAYSTGVKRSAITAKPSARTLELARPKAIQNPEPKPEGVSPEALTATASSRVQQLAKPKEREAERSDEREDPYGVKPEALKAYCSVRTKELAKPKERK